MPLWNQDRVLAAWNFASDVHKDQKVPGTDIAYINHIGTVAMEVMGAVSSAPEGIENPDLAILCALLHDTIEDTGTSFDELREGFGQEVAEGVQALSKDTVLSTKEAQMADSLARIKACPKEVWMVKLADRITNLQPPPAHWTRVKAAAYRDEATVILGALGDAHALLARRLQEKIDHYVRYC
ncbi:phosphohydrolase [Desulfoluna limicola]|uniref:Phosphohydrolase n=1 Tax=Desulfoluna limicola TaxID=2810562 RepID=A0ABM7PJ35_9BACT|nr:HD domain-containing protein [Desulfoluna limicola]BCS97590.1 phosphohydrolase [Desulfoluna limicola]